MAGETGRTSIIKITSQITSGNKSTASGRPQPQKLDEKGVLRRRLTSAAIRPSRHNREPRRDQMALLEVTRATQPTMKHSHTDTQVLLEQRGKSTRESTSLADRCSLTNTAEPSVCDLSFTRGHTQGAIENYNTTRLEMIRFATMNITGNNRCGMVTSPWLTNQDNTCGGSLTHFESCKRPPDNLQSFLNMPSNFLECKVLKGPYFS